MYWLPYCQFILRSLRPNRDWLRIERLRLHGLAAGALARLASSQSGEAAMATAQRLLQLEPAREETHRLLMRLLAAAGQRAQALRQYEHCREGEIIRCPWHGWEFDLRTGQSWFDPRAVRVRRYDVSVEPGSACTRRWSAPALVKAER